MRCTRIASKTSDNRVRGVNIGESVIPMKRLIAVALLFSVALPAWPQVIRPPPPPDDEGDAPPPPPPLPRAERTGYYESCFGVPHVGSAPFGVSGEVVVPISGGSGGAPSLPVTSKTSDEKAWLVAAVLAAIALPAVVYVYDKPAPRLVLQRFQCPTFSLDFVGGVDKGPATLGNGSYGFVSTRLGFGVGHVAGDFQYDGAPRSVSAFSTHLLLRPTPREHIEIVTGLAVSDDDKQNMLWRNAARLYKL